MYTITPLTVLLVAKVVQKLKNLQYVPAHAVAFRYVYHCASTHARISLSVANENLGAGVGIDCYLRDGFIHAVKIYDGSLHRFTINQKSYQENMLCVTIHAAVSDYHKYEVGH